MTDEEADRLAARFVLSRLTENWLIMPKASEYTEEDLPAMKRAAGRIKRWLRQRAGLTEAKKSTKVSRVVVPEDEIGKNSRGDCPRKRSDMTPCVITDGGIAYADDGLCVGCRLSPAETEVPYLEPWHGRRPERVPGPAV